MALLGDCMKHKLRILTIFFLALFIVSLGLLSSNFTPYKFRTKSVENWSDHWLYQGEYYTLNGQHIDIPANEPVILSKHLPADNLSNKYLLIRASLSDVTISINKEIIYKSQRDNFLWTTAPPASLWHLIPLDDSDCDKLVTITPISPYKTMNGLMNPIYLGYHGDLLFKLIDDFGSALAIDFLILIFGVLLLIFAFVSPKGVNSSVWYVGLFSVLVAIWLVSESKMLQFFLGQQWVNASLSYITLTIIPIPLLGYIASITTKRNQPIIKKLIGLSLLSLLTVLGLQLLNIADFYESLIIIHPVIIIQILAISIMLLKELKKYKTQSAVNFVLSIFVLFAFILIEIFQFFIWKTVDVTIYVRIGLLIFILMISFNALRQLLVQIKKSYQASFFEALAYKDPLTQGNNRLAFDKDLEDLYHQGQSLESLELVILDINNLKVINDTFGHLAGDEAIKAAYAIISDNFKSVGKSYRIGGDEFAIIVKQSDKEALKALYDKLHHAIKAYDDTVKYAFDIAYGSVHYDASIDKTAKKLFHRADRNMYIEKNIKKNIDY